MVVALAALKVRLLTHQEAHELDRLAHSRTAPHRMVQRTQLLWAGAQGVKVRTIAQQVGLSALQARKYQLQTDP
jgi:hypothetical protein